MLLRKEKKNKESDNICVFGFGQQLTGYIESKIVGGN